VLLAAMVLQMCGLVVLHRELRRVDRLQEHVAEIEGVLATPIWWYAQMMPRIYPERSMFLVRSREDLEDWVIALAAAGGRGFAWASAEGDEIFEGLPLRSGSPFPIEVAGYAHFVLPIEILPAGRGMPGVDRAWARLRRASVLRAEESRESAPP
jgi:hypothetical protein